MKKISLPKYDEKSIMMHWSNTSNIENNIKISPVNQKSKSSKKMLPKYDEKSIMMHWSNTGF